MTRFPRLLVIILLLCLSTGSTLAQVDTSFVKSPIVYKSYLALVGKNNLNYIAQQFNLNIAEAAIELAKIFPDPVLFFGAFDNGDERMKMGYGATSSLSYTVELGGKRRARIDLANLQAQLTQSLLNNYFRNLRADATLAYLEGMKTRLSLNVELSSHRSIKRLSSADSMRFKLGQITEIDSRQSKVEAGSVLNRVYIAEATWKSSLLNLGMLLGHQMQDTLYLPLGDFSRFEREFDLNALTTEALNNRADLMAALKSKEVSEQALKLARANRVADLGIVIGANNTSYVINKIAPTPSFTAVSAGVAIPLRFSNRYKGQIKTAEYSIKQADILYRETELQIKTEVATAFYSYQAAKKQVEQFNTGLLNEARKVREGKIYSYQRGETSLLEVLNAQRTYNDVQLNYYQALYDYAGWLVELERAVGIWDIDF
ncbi:MAG: TolC family protein [Bacteroidetes bacterium]|nr:TolC family protein [Bacteroidota bacterium]